MDPEQISRFSDISQPWEQRRTCGSGVMNVEFLKGEIENIPLLGAPVMNFVFTVCDNAAKEVCLLWLGHPATARWEVADPASVSGTAAEIERAFREAFVILARRISLFTALPLASLDSLAMKKEIDQIGRS